MAACTIAECQHARRFHNIPTPDEVPTRVDGKVEDVNPEHGNDNDRVLDHVRLRSGAEQTQKAADGLLGPGQEHEREDGSDGAPNHEGLALAPWDAAVVAEHADVGLDEGAREGASDPDQGHERLADAQRQQVGRAVGHLDGPGDLQAADADGQEDDVPDALCLLVLVGGGGDGGLAVHEAIVLAQARCRGQQRRVLVHRVFIVLLLTAIMVVVMFIVFAVIVSRGVGGLVGVLLRFVVAVVVVCGACPVGEIC